MRTPQDSRYQTWKKCHHTNTAMIITIYLNAYLRKRLASDAFNGCLTSFSSIIVIETI